MTTAPPVQGSMNLLTRLSRLVYRRATEEVIGIRLKQFIALDYLREQGGSSQQQLGQSLMLQVTASTGTGDTPAGIFHGAPLRDLLFKMEKVDDSRMSVKNFRV